jgi:hypothetical protein
VLKNATLPLGCPHPTQFFIFFSSSPASTDFVTPHKPKVDALVGVFTEFDEAHDRRDGTSPPSLTPHPAGPIRLGTARHKKDTGGQQSRMSQLPSASCPRLGLESLRNAPPVSAPWGIDDLLLCEPTRLSIPDPIPGTEGPTYPTGGSTPPLPLPPSLRAGPGSASASRTTSCCSDIRCSPLSPLHT